MQRLGWGPVMKAFAVNLAAAVGHLSLFALETFPWLSIKSML
jgi:hypothetical protein